MPDFSERPKYGAVTVQERAALAVAQDTVFFPQRQTDQLFQFQFTFLEADSIAAVLEFFRARCGRAEPFYLPSWRAELPGFSGASGTNLLTVVAPGYGDAHFGTGTYADDFGRQIFIWQPGEALFTSAVVAATALSHGRVELNLERWLPFDVDPKTAVIGFLHLARFDEDELPWEFYGSDAAKVEISFRGIRAWNGEPGEWTLEPIDVDGGGSSSDVLGFESALQVQESFTPVDSRTCRSKGPAVLHTGEVQPMLTDWIAWANTDGIRLLAATSVSVPDNSGTLTGLVGGIVDTQHLALCFNAATGWECLAYQVGSFIRVWMKLFAGPHSYDFDGLDPLLFNTGDVGGLDDPEDALIVCYYRKAGDNRLYLRYSSDAFAVEHLAALLPARPVHLRKIEFSGRRVVLSYLDSGMRHVTLTSKEYPLFS